MPKVIFHSNLANIEALPTSEESHLVTLKVQGFVALSSFGEV
jgi:hypothetical protein